MADLDKTISEWQRWIDWMDEDVPVFVLDTVELLKEQKELLEKKQHDLDQMCYENSRLRHLLNDRQLSNAVLWKDGEQE